MHRIAAPRPELTVQRCSYCDGPVADDDFSAAVCSLHVITIGPLWCCTGCEHRLMDELDARCEAHLAAEPRRPRPPRTGRKARARGRRSYLRPRLA
jgi:hypothetical protein